jgi:hypothetical protein
MTMRAMLAGFIQHVFPQLPHIPHVSNMRTFFSMLIGLTGTISNGLLAAPLQVFLVGESQESCDVGRTQKAFSGRGRDIKMHSDP